LTGTPPSALWNLTSVPLPPVQRGGPRPHFRPATDGAGSRQLRWVASQMQTREYAATRSTIQIQREDARRAKSSACEHECWTETSLVIRARNLGARLPRVGVGDNQTSRTSDESLRWRIFYHRLQERCRQEILAEVLRSQSEWRQQLARIACTEVIDDGICDSA
jgi:hypothetical protein